MSLKEATYYCEYLHASCQSLTWGIQPIWSGASCMEEDKI